MAAIRFHDGGARYLLSSAASGPISWTRAPVRPARIWWADVCVIHVDIRRGAKRTATRQRIAQAAAQLVISRGLAGATVDDIAETAAISRATFFATSTQGRRRR